MIILSVSSNVLLLVVGSYSLSVRQNGGHRRNIKHYRILQLHNGWFCIHPNHPFSTLNQLIDYYSRKFTAFSLPAYFWNTLWPKLKNYEKKTFSKMLRFFCLQVLLMVYYASCLNLAYLVTRTQLQRLYLHL